MRVKQPSFERYIRFYPANLLSTLSIIQFQICIHLKCAPNGSQRYDIDNWATLQPSIAANSSTLATSTTGITSNFPTSSIDILVCDMCQVRQVVSVNFVFISRVKYVTQITNIFKQMKRRNYPGSNPFIEDKSNGEGCWGQDIGFQRHQLH